MATKFRTMVGVGVALAVLGTFGGGASAESNHPVTRAHATKTLRIALVLPDLSNLFIAGVRDGAQVAASKVGATLLVKGTNDAAGQTNAMLSYVGAKVDAIIVDAIDGHAIVPAIKAANKAKIPVIAVQSNVYGGKVASFISEREEIAGLYIGQSVAAFCKSHKPCKVGIVEGIKADQSGATEDKAMKAYVAKFTNIKIVGGAETQYDPAKALNVASNLLTANPDLNYIYAWWDPGAAAAVKAIQSAGKVGKIGVSAQNGDCIAFGLILKGWQTQTSAFFPSVLGGLGITNAVKATKGQALPSFIEAPVLSVTTTLANNWLAGKGQPPAALSADILKRLREAKSGHCPTK
jgi:ribose transport system substrate-binding protein